MHRKQFFLFLTAIVFITQFLISSASAQDNDKSAKIESRSLTDFYSTRMDLMSDDLIHGVVIEETKERKRKRILPFILWTAGAWITLDYINDQTGGGYQPVDEDEFFANLNLDCFERITDAKINLRKRYVQPIVADIVDTNMNAIHGSQSRYSTFGKQISVWQNGFLVGRLAPLYVSLSSSGKNKTNILAAGLNNLADGEIAYIEMYDDETWCSIELDNSDGDDLGVFRTTVDLNLTNIHLSIEIVR